jgi:hypothetical protein
MSNHVTIFPPGFVMTQLGLTLEPKNNCGLIKVARCGFSLGENHEKGFRFPDFLQRGTSWEK